MQLSFFKKSIFLVVLAFVPLIAVYLLLNQLLDFTESNQNFASQRKLRRKMLSVAELSSQEGFYFNLFEKVAFHLSKGKLETTKALISNF